MLDYSLQFYYGLLPLTIYLVITINNHKAFLLSMSHSTSRIIKDENKIFEMSVLHVCQVLKDVHCAKLTRLLMFLGLLRSTFLQKLQSDNIASHANFFVTGKLILHTFHLIEIKFCHINIKSFS